MITQKSQLKRIAIRRGKNQPRSPELYAIVREFLDGKISEAEFDRRYTEAEQSLAQTERSSTSCPIS